MKRAALDILSGLRTGLLYTAVLGMIGYGIWGFCGIHKISNAWMAVISFICCSALVVAGCLGLWGLGLAERIVDEEFTKEKNDEQKKN